MLCLTIVSLWFRFNKFKRLNQYWINITFNKSLNMKVAKSIFKSIPNGIRFLDRYPKHITFTYKNKKEFKSLIGGLISIGTFVVLLLYTYATLRILIEK